MEIPIFSNGKEYISSVRAGEYVGYSSDYVGQLCRAGRIPAKLVGRTWFVDLDALKSHKENRVLGKPRKIDPLITQSALDADQPNQSALKEIREFTLDSSKPLHFKYSSDSTELLPLLGVKKSSSVLRAKYKSVSTIHSVNRISYASLFIPMAVVALFILVPLLNNSLLQGSVVENDFIKSSVNVLTFISSKTQAAATLLVGDILPQSNGADKNTRKAEMKLSADGVFIGTENGLSREEIRSLLLDQTAVEPYRASSTSTTSDDAVNTVIQLKPQENPFGIPQ